MIDANQAVEQAKKSIRSFYPDEDLIALRLEEVDRSDDGDDWLITLGFYVPNTNPTTSPIAIAILGETSKYVREYKVFRISATTGDFMSMKLRDE